MQYLTALLAFSAIMIVLSTLATVAVEGIHLLASRRTADFHRMLQRLFEDAVAPRLKRLAREGELTATAFTLTEERPSSPEVFDVDGRQVLIQMLERQEPEEEELATTTEAAKEQLLTGRRGAMLPTIASPMNHSMST